jgi:hypothetical protein
MLLSPAQIADLTGYVRPRAQIRWLRTNGIRHWIKATGYPSVPESAINPAADMVNSIQPDFDSVN